MPGGDVAGKNAPVSRVTDTEREFSTVVRAQQLSLDGEPLGVARRIADASRTTWNLNLSVDAEGVPWVVFDARLETHAHELFLARVGRDPAAVERLSFDDGASSIYPDLAFGAGRAAVTWWDTRDGNAEVYLAGVRLFFVGGRISLCGSEAGGNWIRHGVVREQRRGPVADGTCAVSDGWGCSAGTRALGGGSQYASMRRRPVAA